MTPGQKAAETRRARKASAARISAAQAEASRVVATGKCPECGAPLYRNLALTGWWQCRAYPCREMRAPGFEALPPCSFQCFTAH